MEYSEVQQEKTPVRVVGNLHRGALQEFKADKLVGKFKPQHEDLLSSWDDLTNVHVRKQAHSEPRPSHHRKRSASGDIQHPKKLFGPQEDETFETRWLPSERCLVHGDLKHRRSISTEVRQVLMKPFRRAGNPSTYTANGRNRAFRGRSRWVIPIDSTFKVIWDLLTLILSIANSHAMHVSIRERKFGFNTFIFFCNIWFMLDILLNFVTERKTANGDILRDYRSIFARYLTSWFAVDILALMPWETLYVKPIIDLQNKRGFLQKYFFRSKAVVRVTRHLRGKHFRWFGTVTRYTKQHGVGATRLLRLIIKYIPKYFMFLKNMKGGIVVRGLRQFQWFRRFYNNILTADGDKQDAMTGSLTKDDVEDDDLSSKHSGQRNPRLQLVYETWELMDDDEDDDGVPL